ncbi:class I SAM-dependent methyltransferase [Nocardioides houyundeii]|uniref:class I SAM-dependent methyltransferase n=1 Tax=Nocardioides houyundeii TaxID=2045452 RepID=UPI000C769FF0|nr:class I SAM-dependent methyltransferase [Nocardioides houyundeii]
MGAGEIHYCTVCRQLVKRPFRPGPNGRPGARCPRCRGLERHRFFALLLDLIGPQLTHVETVLDIAPTPQSISCLSALEPSRYLRLDLGLDNRLVDALGDITRLPVRDACVDLLVCYHVLEHVPDDHAAIAELARVLSPGGLALVQVPIRFGTTTDEDPSAPEAERVVRFGQADHVRYYGDDFEDRLTRHGLSFHRILPADLLGPALCDYLKVEHAEPVWVVRRRPAPVEPLAFPGLISLHDAMLTQLANRTRERDRARRRVEGQRPPRPLQVRIADRVRASVRARRS